MTRRSREFFATSSDLLELCKAVEAKHAIRYTRAGLFDQKAMQQFNSAQNIEGFGIARKGDQNHEPIFLITDSDLEVVVREVPQRRGGIKHAIDQMENPKSVGLKVGGEYRDDAIIAGQLGTVSADLDSVQLFKLFSTEMGRRFEKIRGNYVGKNAAKALDNGVRLTASIQTPTSCDLRR